MTAAQSSRIREHLTLLSGTPTGTCSHSYAPAHGALSRSGCLPCSRQFPCLKALPTLLTYGNVAPRNPQVRAVGSMPHVSLLTTLTGHEPGQKTGLGRCPDEAPGLTGGYRASEARGDLGACRDGMRRDVPTRPEVARNREVDRRPAPDRAPLGQALHGRRVRRGHLRLTVPTRTQADARVISDGLRAA